MGLSGCSSCSCTRRSTACCDSATLRTEFFVFGSVTSSSPSMRVTCLFTVRIRSFTFKSSHWSASSSPRRSPLDSSRKNIGRTPYFSASWRYLPIFSGGRMVISFLSLGGIRQFSQGLYGMSRSFTACFSAACSTAWTRRTKVLDKALSLCFDPRCIRPFSFKSLYIL